MTQTRKIRLGAFLPGGGQHIAAWRHPDSPVDGATSFDFHVRLAQEAERGLFDAYFLADGLAIAFGGGVEGGNAKIAGFEPALQAMDDAALANQTVVFRERLAGGEKLDALLPEAFATVREAARRVLGQRHYDVQMVGGIVLHRRSALARAAYVCPNNYLGRPSPAVRANWTPAEKASCWLIATPSTRPSSTV